MINSEELLFIAFLALLLIGPERLPQYAEQLGRLVRNIRKMATGAKASLEEELGDEIEDFKKFDPRQYDPRRIVRDALLDDVIPASKPATPAAPIKPTAAAPIAAAAAAAATATAAAAAPATARPALAELVTPAEPEVADQLEGALARAAAAKGSAPAGAPVDVASQDTALEAEGSVLAEPDAVPAEDAAPAEVESAEVAPEEPPVDAFGAAPFDDEAT